MRQHLVNRLLRWAVMGGAVLASGAVMAQGPYLPSSPTISPWMGLFQRNPGPLDNYNTFVRPQQQLQGVIQQQNGVMMQQGNAIQTLSGQVTKIGDPSSRIRATGAGAMFMNYSHYYPAASHGMGRRGAGAAAHPAAAPTMPRGGF